jgi:hypothetical protein
LENLSGVVSISKQENVSNVRNVGNVVGESENEPIWIERCVKSAQQPYREAMMPYEKLTASIVAHELALEIFGTTENWPKNELYGQGEQRCQSLQTLPKGSQSPAPVNSAATLTFRLAPPRSSRTCCYSDVIEGCYLTTSGSSLALSEIVLASFFGSSAGQSRINLEG